MSLQSSYPKSTAAASRRRRLLIVEDDQDTARILAHVLAEYDVDVAEDGADALLAIHARRPDLIVTDLWMPRVDGFTLVRTLKGDPSFRSIPVICLTAATEATNVAAAISAGARHFLPKPVETARLLGLVRRSLP